METEVNFKGIVPKIVKVEDDHETRYLVRFEVATDDFKDAVEIKGKIESRLNNWLTGQKELKAGE